MPFTLTSACELVGGKGGVGEHLMVIQPLLQ